MNTDCWVVRPVINITLLTNCGLSSLSFLTFVNFNNSNSKADVGPNTNKIMFVCCIYSGNNWMLATLGVGTLGDMHVTRTSAWKKGTDNIVLSRHTHWKQNKSHILHWAGVFRITKTTIYYSWSKKRSQGFFYLHIFCVKGVCRVLVYI